MPRVEALNRQWKVNPPLVVSTRLAAMAQGVKFDSAHASLTAAPMPSPDPAALVAELGAVEHIYVPPARGLPIG